jgi:hypothetical protein
MAEGSSGRVRRASLFARHAVIELVSTGVFVGCFLASWFAYQKAVPWEMS